MTSEQSWTLEFCDAQLEHDYQRWHHAEYGPSVQSGLAVSNFLYLIISLGFDGWSRSYDPEVSSTGLPDELLIITDLLTGILLTICFALSFTSCAADRPNLFSAIVLLLTLFLIAMRAYVIALSNSASFTAIAPVVTVVMIVCFLLGVALLQMPFVATLTVGLLTMAAYGSLALLEIGRIAPDGSGWYPIALAGATFAAALHARQLEAMRRRLFVSCPPHAQIHAQQHAQMHAQQHAQIHAQQHAQVHAQRLGQGSHPRAAGRLGAFARASSRTAELDQPAAAAVAQSDVAQSDIAQSDVAQSDASLPVADEGEEEGMRGWGPLLASDAMGGTVAGEAEMAPDLAEATEAALSAADVGCSGGLRAQAFSSINSDNSQPEPSHSAGLFDSSLRAVRGSIKHTASELRGHVLGGSSSGGTVHGHTSSGAVQHALYETGAPSLRAFMAHEMSHAVTRLPVIGSMLPTTARGSASQRHPAFLGAEPPPVKTVYELVDASQLPSWITPYAFVTTGYRCHFSYRLAFASLFRLHNETVNVWTELLPAVGFGVWTYAFLDAHAGADETDRYIVGTGLAVCTVARPLCSGLAHLLHCTDAAGYIVWWSVDYLSICAAILASSLVYGRFAFYCTQPLQLLFFTSAAGLLSTTIVAVMAVASPALRATSFTLFILFCNGVPFVYQAFAKLGGGAHADAPSRYLVMWAASLATFSCGLLIKSSSLPERVVQAPWTDLLLTSHVLWHVVLNVGFVLGTFLAWDVYLSSDFYVSMRVVNGSRVCG